MFIETSPFLGGARSRHPKGSFPSNRDTIVLTLLGLLVGFFVFGPVLKAAAGG